MATRRTGKEKDRTEEPVICPICTEEVVDHNGRKKAVITLFSVMGSVHRQCAGLSKAAFESISNSGSRLFHCPRCIITQQSKEISALKASVAELADA